jgi:hypothetical protein
MQSIVVTNNENDIINIEEFLLKYKEWNMIYMGYSKHMINIDELQNNVENSILSKFMVFDPISYKKIFKKIRMLNSSSDTINEGEIPIKRYILNN